MKKYRLKIQSINRKIYLVFVILFVLICVGISIFCALYYSRLKSTVKEESKSYLLEISRQMTTNIEKNIDDNFSALETISLAIQNSTISTFEQLNGFVSKLETNWKYKKIMLIDENAVSYDKDGSIVHLISNEYLQTVEKGKYSMSSSEVIDKTECVVFAIPIEGITIESKNMLALAASYELMTFDRILSMNAFDGKGYAHIIRPDGTVVIRSSSDAALQSGYNILNSLEQATFYDGQSLQSVCDDIAAAKQGFAEFTDGGINQYMTFTPLVTKNEAQSDSETKAQNWQLLTFVPVDVVNVRSILMLNFTLLFIGLLAGAFAVLFAVLLFLTYHNRKRLERIAYNDEVTEGNSIEYFYEISDKILSSHDRKDYALVYTNIEKFKLLNEQFGRKNCDYLLKTLYKGISSDLAQDECISRLAADNFCLLVRYKDADALCKRILHWKKLCGALNLNTNTIHQQFFIEFGVYGLSSEPLSPGDMIDRAKLALSAAHPKVFENIRFAIYDESVKKALRREKELEDHMENAMKNGEFQVYLQPKYDVRTEKIAGAEALVRWNSSFDGMVYPDEFISLFEKNGFITRLDLYVFEKVCQTMEKWSESGCELVKVSVNCSRANLKNKDIIDEYVKISEKYKVEKKYFEIEFTENIIFDDAELFSDIISCVHNAGFGCSMDDFGSGYSSLSMIQNINVDTVKMDKVFFKDKNKQSSKRTLSVVANIISLAKALDMITVAEGVEERKQVEMLKELGCDLIQGYYFAKPMPIAEFEKLAFGRVIAQEEGV